MKRYLITNHFLLNFVIFFSIFFFSLFYYSPFYVYAYSNCSGSNTDGCCYNTAPNPTEGYCGEHGITDPLDPLCKCQTGLECVDCRISAWITCDPGYPSSILYCVDTAGECGYAGNRCCDGVCNSIDTVQWYNAYNRPWELDDGYDNCTCATCGIESYPCCIRGGGTWCEDPLACRLSGGPQRCYDPTDCGYKNGPCCGISCDAPLTCDTVNNICIDPPCGAVGEPCCVAADPCFGKYCVHGICQEDAPAKPPSAVYRGPVIKRLEDILGPVTKILYYGGLAIGVFFIILSGYKLMVSEGDPQRTKAAQEQLTSAIIGIIFILLSVTIIRVIIDEIIKI